MKQWNVKIAGTGGFLPGPAISNQELIDRLHLNTTDAWIRAHLGIEERHWAGEGEAVSHISAEAAKLALESAEIHAKDLDRIILCTTTGDWTSPAAACKVQNLIGADCPAEDKQSACASFLFGLDHGGRLIRTGLRHVLVIGADIKSRFVDLADRRLAPLFADGAGAFVLSAHDGPGGLLDCELWSDGSRALNFYTPAGGSAMPASRETVEKNLHTARLMVDGKIIFDDAVEIMTRLSRLVCERSGVETKEINYFIPHQANLAIMKTVAANLGIQENRVVVTINRTGNTISGTIPYSFDAAFRKGMKPGSLILMTTAGAGYAGGAALYRMP